MAVALDISLDRATDGPLLRLAGDFDVRSTWEVRNALYQHIQASAGDVVVDLTDVTSIDLTALKVLAAASHNAHHAGRRLRLRGCGPAVRRLLHMSHLIRAVEVERVPVPA